MTRALSDIVGVAHSLAGVVVSGWSSSGWISDWGCTIGSSMGCTLSSANVTVSVVTGKADLVSYKGAAPAGSEASTESGLEDDK